MFFLLEAFFQRPTESRGLVWFRGAVATLFTIGFLAYAIYLCIQVQNDIPLVQSFEVDLNSTKGVPIPAIEICTDGSDVVFPHCDFMNNGNIAKQYVNCAPWIKLELDNPNGTYCHVFSVNDDMYFDVNFTSIDFYFKILNLTAAIAGTIAAPSLGINVFDAFFSPLGSSAGWTKADLEEWQDIHDGKAATAANQGFSTEIYFTRSSLYAIRSSDIGAVIGLTPNYDIVPRVTIATIIYPLHSSPNFSDTGLSGHFALIPAGETEDIEHEQRSHTVLSALAFAGGAWGGLFGLYTILFGHQRLAPWGVMHRFMFFNKNDKLRWSSANNQFPLVSSIDLDGDTDVGSRTDERQRAERVESRVLELESLLRDYFLDSAYLARMKSLQNSENSEKRFVV